MCNVISPFIIWFSKSTGRLKGILGWLVSCFGIDADVEVDAVTVGVSSVCSSVSARVFFNKMFCDDAIIWLLARVGGDFRALVVKLVVVALQSDEKERGLVVESVIDAVVEVSDGDDLFKLHVVFNSFSFRRSSAVILNGIACMFAGNDFNVSDEITGIPLYGAPGLTTVISTQGRDSFLDCNCEVVEVDGGMET